MKMISDKQIKIIWSIWRGILKYDGDKFYEAIEDLYGAKKMHQLTYKDADEFIEGIKRKAEPLGKLSVAQRRKLLYLKRQLNMSDEYFGNYMRKITKVDNIGWLSWQQARILIAAISRSLKYYKKKLANEQNI